MTWEHTSARRPSNTGLLRCHCISVLLHSLRIWGCYFHVRSCFVWHCRCCCCCCCGVTVFRYSFIHYAFGAAISMFIAVLCGIVGAAAAAVAMCPVGRVLVRKMVTVTAMVKTSKETIFSSPTCIFNKHEWRAYLQPQWLG